MGAKGDYMRNRRNVETKVVGGMSALDFLIIALTCIFVVLKLCGVINWSWVWVFFPLLAYIVVGAIAIGVCVAWVIWLNKR